MKTTHPPTAGKRRRHNPERKCWRGRSHRTGRPLREMRAALHALDIEDVEDEEIPCPP